MPPSGVPPSPLASSGIFSDSFDDFSFSALSGSPPCSRSSLMDLALPGPSRFSPGYPAAIAKRRRRRADRSGTGKAKTPPATSDYTDEEGNVLTLRDELTEGTLRSLAQLDARPAASAEDRWQRRAEVLFERLVVRWEIAGLPIERQKELLGRYRMASAEERRRVREALAEHLRTRYPDVEV